MDGQDGGDVWLVVFVHPLRARAGLNYGCHDFL